MQEQTNVAAAKITPEVIETTRSLVQFFIKRKRFVVSGMDEEDVAQECILKFIENGCIEKFDATKSSFTTFLSHAIKNLIVDLMRKNNRKELSTVVPVLAGGEEIDITDYIKSDRYASPDEQVLALDLFNRVKFALPWKPAYREKVSLRQIFVEHYEKMLPPKEIASKYSCSISWICNQINLIQEVGYFC